MIRHATASSIQVILMVATLTSCEQEEGTLEPAGEVNSLLEYSQNPTQTKDSLMLAKEGSVRFLTTEPNRTLSLIKEAAKAHQGTISEERSAEVSDELQYYLKIRVPSIHFDSLLDRIEGEVESIRFKRIDAKDVTEEFTDLRTRIKSKKDLHSRYTALLTKADSIKQTLEIENALEEVQSAIEKMEGRSRFLQDRVSYSTLELTFFSKKTDPSMHIGARLSAGFGVGLRGLSAFFVALVHLWPLLIAGVGAGALLHRRKKRVIA